MAGLQAPHPQFDALRAPGRYDRSGEPLEDLIQVASMALVKAIDRDDPDRGCAFTSFAGSPILREAIARLRCVAEHRRRDDG